MQYDLVFQGGGAKGMAFVGAMQEFEQRKHTFRRLVGTSAGAINAALIAAGYTAKQMESALNETMKDGRPVFESFMAPPSLNEINSVTLDDSLSVSLLKALASLIPGAKSLVETLESLSSLEGIKYLLDKTGQDWLKDNAASIYSLLEFGGFYTANNFISWLERKLNEQDSRYGGATLGSLYQMTGNDLSLCVADITQRKLLVLNHRTAPNIPVIWAVRMSMSIPLVWPPVTWKSTWGTYKEGDIEHVITDHRIVDGGALSNFALRLTTTAGSTVRAVMADDPNISEIEFAQFNAKANTIGFMLDSSIAVEGGGGAAPNTGLAAVVEHMTDWLKHNAPETNGATMLSQVLSSMMVGNDNFVMATQEDAVIRLPAGGIGALEFNMTPERRDALVEQARHATEVFFKDRHDFALSELFMAVGDNGKFTIGATVNGEAHPNDWIGLFKSPDDAEANVQDGNWVRVNNDNPNNSIEFETITEAQLGQYEARYYAFRSRAWFGGNNYKLIKSTGPLNRVIAR